MHLSGATLREITSESKVDSRRHHVCTRSRGELHLIPIREISFFNADQKYVCVHHSNGQDLIDDSLKSLELEFADAFVRIHRAALVAVDQIDRLEKLPTGKTRVVLRSGSQQDDNELIISRRHLTDVRHRLKGG